MATHSDTRPATSQQVEILRPEGPSGWERSLRFRRVFVLNKPASSPSLMWVQMPNGWDKIHYYSGGNSAVQVNDQRGMTMFLVERHQLIICGEPRDK